MGCFPTPHQSHGRFVRNSAARSASRRQTERPRLPVDGDKLHEAAGFSPPFRTRSSLPLQSAQFEPGCQAVLRLEFAEQITAVLKKLDPARRRTQQRLEVMPAPGLAQRNAEPARRMAEKPNRRHTGQPCTRAENQV